MSTSSSISSERSSVGSINEKNRINGCGSLLVVILILLSLGLFIYIWYTYYYCPDNDNYNSNNNNNGVMIVKSGMHNQNQIMELPVHQLQSASNQKSILVVFMAEGCGWCTKLKQSGVLQEVARQIDDNVYTIHTNQMGAAELMNQWRIRGFPTIGLVFKGNLLSMYEGDRSAASIVNWYKHHSLRVPTK
jgi:thioredoxin-related protein